MRIVNSNDNVHDFFHFIATRKCNLLDCQFVHIAMTGETAAQQFSEVEQLLEFHIHGDHAWLLRAPEANELVLFTNKNDSLILSRIEKSFHSNFDVETCVARFRGLSGDGLELLSKILKPYVVKDDGVSNVAYARMSRPGNNILVVDDDMMVLKQMEKVLSDFGHVITLQDPAQFEEVYKSSAPDILFLDIHLRTAKGNELLKDLRLNIDPFAHVVMISSDTNEEIILDIKGGGAKGFVVKPFNQNNLYQQVKKAPTMVVKSGR